jgi:hypothetical protein
MTRHGPKIIRPGYQDLACGPTTSGRPTLTLSSQAGALLATLEERDQMSVIEGPRSTVCVILRVGIVLLTLATAYIHTTLGSMMFMANAAGYAVLAVAMIAPFPIAARYRWLIRAALVGFTVFTILGWVMFGARFWLGYLDKGLEVGLIVLLAIEMLRYDGGPANVLRRLFGLGLAVVRLPFARKGNA